MEYPFFACQLVGGEFAPHGGATHQSFVNRVNNNIGGPMGAGGMEVTVSQNSDLDPPVPVINYTYLL